MPSNRRHSLFRPCIDLHNGQVKQIVGGTLSDENPETLKTNFVAKSVPSRIQSFQQDFEQACIINSHPSAWFAELYKQHNLEGGHVIKLGPGNDEAAKEALAAWLGAFGCANSIHSSDMEC